VLDKAWEALRESRTAIVTTTPDPPAH
jgi:hypothetical protein